MNNSFKGAFLSGVVFPGLGQIILKRYKRGAVIIIVFSVSLFVFLIKAIQHALTILEKIQSEGGAITLNEISAAATRASTATEGMTLKLLLLVIIFFWVFGIVDAYRIGRKKDIDVRSGTGR